jgi:inner membrane transporter RhtA
MTQQATRAPIPPWTLAVTAMLAVQLSAALSVGLIEQLGPAGTAWLRLSMGAILFLAVTRPPLRSLRRRDLPALLGLGTATAIMTLAFLAAIERIPLGTAVAVEFLGPLTVAALRSNARALVWPIAALAGVILLTEPWHGTVDVAGVGLAAIAACGWAVYILLTQRVGDRFEGVKGLSMTIPIAAVVAATVGIPQAIGRITPLTLLYALGLAALLPLLSFTLEMLALRRMTHTAFGTLMSVEPAIGLALGLIVLHQTPSIVQAVGITVVVAAGAAAQFGGTRRPDENNMPPPRSQVP